MPVDILGAPVSVLLEPDFDVYIGATHSDGTFSVPNVPVGKVLLRLDSRYLELRGDEVDLVVDALGRPTSTIASSVTPLRFDVAGLSPWQATDELQMFCSSSGTMAWQMQSDATSGSPSVNDTSLTAFTYDLSKAGAPNTIVGSAGDRLSFAQLGTTSDGLRSYRTVTRKFTPSSFDVTNGASVNVTGAFGAVTPGTSIESTWDRPAFDAQVIAYGSPGNAANWSTLAVSALPEANARGFYWDEPDVLIFAPGYATDHSPVVMSWPVGDPYPPEWTRFAWVRYYRYHSVQLSGGTPLAVGDRMLAYRELSTVSAQAPIEPIVGFVVAPLINGMNAKQALTGVGTTPTISWTAPTIGSPSRYYVDLYQVAVEGGVTRSRRIAFLETSSTEITVPPNILGAGLTYLFEITARSAAGLDLEATPNLRTLPEGWATVTTGLVTP